MFSLEQAPRFGQDNPEIYMETFGINALDPVPETTFISPQEIVLKSMLAIQEYLPIYLRKASNLQKGLNSKTGNCITRTSLLHTLVAPFDHVQPGIAYTYSESIGLSHSFNTVSATDDTLDMIVDNGLKGDGKGNLFGSLWVANQGPKIKEACFGGVSNVDNLLQLRRKKINDYNKDEIHLMLLEAGGENEYLEEVDVQEFNIERTDGATERRLDRVPTVVFFGSKATSVVDVLTGYSDDQELELHMIDILMGLNLKPIRTYINDEEEV